ncbi:MAG: hypothetical protein C4617_04275 [Candidatus Liberibacter europaeus]|uniref:Uncharacterized protein n=1 Tax=Candidatus Liberibacter europaeus TaxID=744859 RepID=A0A2T4VXB9_9HYPH|nr:hypothetical protein [Candidatus Liberibacter europaeus]PTL86420.1 MAG: hypothetical protein C4617_04275 [Candidatus Liberibacter europaeus]
MTINPRFIKSIAISEVTESKNVSKERNNLENKNQIVPSFSESPESNSSTTWSEEDNNQPDIMSPGIIITPIITENIDIKIQESKQNNHVDIFQTAKGFYWYLVNDTPLLGSN